ncbi:MAG: saccharopine dehydrogenase C-terminal domain-containing protein [Cytophagales bacterium]
MKKILILGNGRSAQFLINALYEKRIDWNIKLTVVDAKLLVNRLDSDKFFDSFIADLQNEETLSELVNDCDICISLLPPSFHFSVAKQCVRFKKSMFTASYLSPEIKSLSLEAQRAKVLIGMELGLDPGIDHLTALHRLDELKSQGAIIDSFESFCGGLVDIEDENNPIKYKISWNPGNVVNAGQNGKATFLFENKIYSIPPNRLFENPMEINLGSDELRFEMYPNRDSIAYQKIYELENAKTFIRGTLRRSPFCKCWNVVVKNGWIDHNFIFENSERRMTWKDLFSTFQQPWSHNLIVDNEIAEFFKFMDFFSNEKIPLDKFTSAKALEYLLVEKLSFKKEEKDRVVMIHRIEYTLNGLEKKEVMLMDEIGDAQFTAMSKWVGMPILGMIELFLEGKTSNLLGVYSSFNREIVNLLQPKMMEMGLKMRFV